ncbi:hypothetical protein FQZ97_836310 [compost metagenome]
MVLDHQVQQVGGLLLDAWIEELPTEGLHDIAQQPFETVVPEPAEQLAGLPPAHQVSLERSDSGVGVPWLDDIADVLGEAVPAEAFAVELVEQDEGAGVAGNDTYQPARLGQAGLLDQAFAE